MQQDQSIALLCEVAFGAILGQRVILIPAANGSTCKTVVPLASCWHRGGSPVRAHEPQSGTLPGLVAAHWLEERPGDCSLVRLADGDVLVVHNHVIVQTPAPRIQDTRKTVPQ